MQHKQVPDLLDGVGDIIQPFGQGIDLLPIEAGDERCRQPGEDLSGDPVALMLEIDQPLGHRLGRPRLLSMSSSVVAAVTMLSAATSKKPK